MSPADAPVRRADGGPAVLVAGVGNLFLGDDGFGPEVARRLAAQPLAAGVRVVDYGIRGMHLAYDLVAGVDALVLVDAVPPAPGADEPPGTLVVLEVGADDIGSGALDAHGMDPVSVLASLGVLGGQLPPTVLVGCRPGDLAEGIGLTPAVAAAVDPAVARVRELVEELRASPGPAPATAVATSGGA